MSVTIQSLVDQISYDLLENSVGGPGLSRGIVTTQEVLDAIGQVALDFARQTSLEFSIFTQQAEAGVSQYTIPTLMGDVYSVFVNGVILEKGDSTDLYARGQWQRKPGMPRFWHQDGLPIKILEIVPAPSWDGAPIPVPLSATPPFGVYGSFQPGSRNLTFVGGSLGAQETYAITDILTGIPDSFAPYIVFGVLAKIFSMDGEAKDQQRALYCGSRWQEGLSAGRSLLLDLMEDEAKQARA